MPLEAPGLGSQEPSGQGLGLGTTSHSSAAPATQCVPRVGRDWGWGLDQGQCKGSGLGSFMMPGGGCLHCVLLSSLPASPGICVQIIASKSWSQSP